MVPEGFQIDPKTYTTLMSTIEKDCSLLESNDNMDYSLLLGVHNLDRAQRELGGSDLEKTSLSQTNTTHLTLQGGIPATNKKGEQLLIFVGIIDILQNYRLSKKIAHAFKSVITDGVSVSKHNLHFYVSVCLLVYMSLYLSCLCLCLCLKKSNLPFALFRTLCLCRSLGFMQAVSRSSCRPKFSEKGLHSKIVPVRRSANSCPCILSVLPLLKLNSAQQAPSKNYEVFPLAGLLRYRG